VRSDKWGSSLSECDPTLWGRRGEHVGPFPNAQICYLRFKDSVGASYVLDAIGPICLSRFECVKCVAATGPPAADVVAAFPNYVGLVNSADRFGMVGKR
jgi:hypothetical protein